MKKMTYVIIRYSVLIKNTKAWNIATNDLEEYEKKLFNPIRLEQHFELFRKVTLPSILAQTRPPCSTWLKVVIVTSEKLPKWNRSQLESLVDMYDWLYIDFLPETGQRLTRFITEDLKTNEEDVLVSTIRLDDDDALASNFFENLSRYFKEYNVGFGVSFGGGYAGFYDFITERYEKIVEYYYPKLALGMCFFNIFRCDSKSYDISNIETVYDTGKHTEVDLKIPIIIDSRQPMYIRTLYSTSDSSIDVRRDIQLRKKPSIDKERIYEGFPFLKNRLSADLEVKYDSKAIEFSINKSMAYCASSIELSEGYNLLIAFNDSIKDNGDIDFNLIGCVKDELEFTCLNIQDPLINNHSHLHASWYLGSAEYSGLNFFIRNTIKDAYLLTDKRPLLLGYLDGGFAALVQSIYLRSAGIPHDILICNPQTNIFQANEIYIDDYFNKFGFNENLDSSVARRTYLRNIGSIYELYLLDVRSNYTNIYYLQDINDKVGIKKHLEPFLGDFFEDKFVLDYPKEYTDDKFNLIMYDSRLTPTKEKILNIINERVVSKENNKDLIKNKKVVFENKFSKDNYSFAIDIFSKEIVINVSTLDTSFSFEVFLLINDKLTGQKVMLDQNTLYTSFEFNFNWDSNKVSISVFQTDKERKCSARYLLVSN